MKKVMLIVVIALAVIFYLWGQPVMAQASDTTVAIVAMDNGDVYIVKYKSTNPTSMTGYAFNDPNAWSAVKLMYQADTFIVSYSGRYLWVQAGSNGPALFIMPYPASGGMQTIYLPQVNK